MWASCIVPLLNALLVRRWFSRLLGFVLSYSIGEQLGMAEDADWMPRPVITKDR